MSLLDTVAPVGWLNPNPRHAEDWFSTFKRKGYVPIYSNTAIESLLSQCHKEARKKLFNDLIAIVNSFDFPVLTITQLRRMAEREK